VALALVFIGRANAGHTARGSEPIVPAVVAASWETVPILHPRLGQAATLLPDGRVWIVGGATPNPLERTQAPITASEIYDPLAKRFSPGPSLPSRASSPLAAPVVDGILVAVGFDDNGARIVDVGKGTVRPVGPMSVVHGQGTMVPLLDGTALIFGGGGRESHSVAETYVPETRSFQRVGDLQVKRFRCPATLLKDGRVLLTGGTSSETATYNRRIADAELYDPTTRKFTRIASMRKSRDGHTATALPDGRVLIAGGYNEEDGTAASAEIYDPKGASFREIAPMRLPRANHAAALLADGRVLIVGGNSHLRGKDLILRSAEIFDPSTERFVETAAMESAREDFSATLLSTGDVLIVGGWSGAEGGTAALFHLEGKSRE